MHTKFLNKMQVFPNFWHFSFSQEHQFLFCGMFWLLESSSFHFKLLGAVAGEWGGGGEGGARRAWKHILDNGLEIENVLSAHPGHSCMIALSITSVERQSENSTVGTSGDCLAAW